MCPLQETASESNRGYGLLATFHVVRAATNAGKNVCYVVVWPFLLFGLFGCLCFCTLGGGACYFLLFGRERGPRPNSKKKSAPAPSERLFFCCLGGLACSFFC